MEEFRSTQEKIAKSFLFLLGLAALTEYGLSTTKKPMLDSPSYQAVRQVSVLNVAPNDGVRIFPLLARD